jgi:type II secretory pathway component PulM
MWGSGATQRQLDAQNVSNQRLLEWLEAENAELRGSVIELALQIQALRDGTETLAT